MRGARGVSSTAEIPTMAGPERSDSLRVLLGVTGGIAAYKSPEIVRRLTERGCEVQVVMTAGARRFVTPTTFQAVSGRRVREDLWDEAAEAAMGHIELARWADVVLVAPAMNQAMWQNPAVEANRATLQARGVKLLGPASGDQACGDVGPGRMLEPAQIAEALLGAVARTRRQALANLNVVVTAGPTREPIDPVRYITNRSSGKMGFAVAQAAREAGASVVLVSGPVALATPPGVRRLDVETAQEMHDAVQREIAGADLFIACAAVADYRPQTASRQKIKRSAQEMELPLVRSPDTLASVAGRADPPFTVGFAAETEDVAQHARAKLERKRVDMIAANLVGPTCGFDRETNELTVYWRGGERKLGEATKGALARELVDLIGERYRGARRVAATADAGALRAPPVG